MVLIQSKIKENLLKLFPEVSLEKRQGYYQKTISLETFNENNKKLSEVEVYEIDDEHLLLNKRIVKRARWGQKVTVEIKGSRILDAKNYLRGQINANLKVIENSIFVKSLVRRVIIFNTFKIGYLHKRLDKYINLNSLCSVINVHVSDYNTKTFQNIHIDDFIYLYYGK